MTEEQAAWVLDHFVGLANGIMVMVGLLVINILLAILILVFK